MHLVLCCVPSPTQCLAHQFSPSIFIEQMNEHMNGRQTSGWIERVVPFAEMGTWKQGWGRRAGFVEVWWVGGWGTARWVAWGLVHQARTHWPLGGPCGWCSPFLLCGLLQAVPAEPGSDAAPGQTEGEPAAPVLWALPACLGLCQQGPTQPVPGIPITVLLWPC